ncbi:MAG TPA: 2Fe-2S iron-sulfur cluster-binding protein [Saprospiraceae bacterium]|nr:2Fe-2S iron-sulfur cluster binding domain-containing protein [Saprospiraceae bacterium]HPG06841.1 2Fe-2S iron-sulfur cluster-binding protein [Saprospiraceae bacterium]HPR01344.1 2Fe-2S iron-sulfur cluster-binding protein [Saprospiraceae bacterium]HQU51660.1 2Fe-2S iron-sulfur cluster-binding protein [Saprospiraceae bacterium]HRV84333.1 2Fe-2S iron-sulfur cluster-binding protein [Saprospiraceae bacterium]
MTKLIAHLDGERIELDMPDNEKILYALLDEGYDPPFSCQAGSCSTCMAKLVDGKVSMDECYALTDEEVDAGYILTCQSRPLTDTVEVDYNV